MLNAVNEIKGLMPSTLYEVKGLMLNTVRDRLMLNTVYEIRD